MISFLSARPCRRSFAIAVFEAIYDATPDGLHVQRVIVTTRVTHFAYMVGQQIEEVSMFTDASRDDPPNDQSCGKC